MHSAKRNMLQLVMIAGAILLITSGIRMSLGLFVKPMASAELDIVAISCFCRLSACMGHSSACFGRISG